MALTVSVAEQHLIVELAVISPKRRCHVIQLCLITSSIPSTKQFMANHSQQMKQIVKI